MVNFKKFLETASLVYNKALKNNICLLIVGGSIGRGNYIEGWSDADLLLVLEKPNSKALQLVRKCEEYIKRRFNIDTDTMITSKFTIEHISPEKLHGKIKNFLFFMLKEKILIRRNIKISKINRQEFGYGFWATYAEQEKNFLRRNAEIDMRNKSTLQTLARKNIKIIFLILKQYLANSISSSTYEEVISSGKKILPISITNHLEKYRDIRLNNQLSIMSVKQLRNLISESIEIFYNLGKLVIKHTNSL